MLRRLRCLSGRSVGAVATRVLLFLLLGLLLVRLLGKPPHQFDSDDEEESGGEEKKQKDDIYKPLGRSLDLKDDALPARAVPPAPAPAKDHARPAPAPLASGTDEDGFTYPVSLELDLPRELLEREDIKDPQKMRRQYGFNLAASNKMPLNRHISDTRNDECKALDPLYPHDMPKTSVIIIFYNEALSTLLRNVVSVLNRTPQHLLGEIVLVDDNSTLPELKYLPAHLEKLPKKIRLVRRNVHNGIVGARVRGAREARFPIIAFIDSHGEALPGWLEPLVYRIYRNRKTVVVPSIRPIDTNGLSVSSSRFWPPARGSFTWRMAFTHAGVDAKRDAVNMGLGPADGGPTRPVKTPVMPGGLFAMDREWFTEIGEYDEEILYYGAEHLELSFRVWMCGGSMETVPCSNVGHIYREFDRFAVDDLLDKKKIGPILDRNDQRVAEVWMDEYKKIVYDTRGFHGKDPGDLTSRRAIRERLSCKSFDWYLKNIHPDLWVPDIEPLLAGVISDPEKHVCIDNMQRDRGGPVGVYGCHGLTTQRWRMMKDGVISNGVSCIMHHILSPGTCTGGDSWALREDGTVSLVQLPNSCLAYDAAHGMATLESCATPPTAAQRWTATVHEGERAIHPQTAPGHCLQHLEPSSGYFHVSEDCSRPGTITKEGNLKAKGSCIVYKPAINQGVCTARSTPKFDLDLQTKLLHPKNMDLLCVTRHESSVSLEVCSPELAIDQRWIMSEHL